MPRGYPVLCCRFTSSGFKNMDNLSIYIYTPAPTIFIWSSHSNLHFVWEFSSKPWPARPQGILLNEEQPLKASLGSEKKPKMLWKKPQNQQNRASMDIIGYNGIFGAWLTKVIQLYHQLYININKWNKRGRKTATYECLRNTPKPWVYRCIFWMILVSLVFLRKPHVLKLEPTKWKLCYRAISEFGGVKEPGIIMPCPVQIRFNGDGEQF